MTAFNINAQKPSLLFVSLLAIGTHQRLFAIQSKHQQDHVTAVYEATHHST